MSGSSTAVGYLVPSASSVEDDGLDDILQAMVVGVTGLAGNLVRPRWQETPPPRPPLSTTWAAVGVQNTTPIGNTHHFLVPGATEPEDRVHVSRQESLEVLVSFYGPGAGASAGRLRDGLYLDQNRDQLRLNDINLVSTGAVTPANEVVNEQWQRRRDLTLFLTREVKRVYTVLQFASAGGILDVQSRRQPFEVER